MILTKSETNLKILLQVWMVLFAGASIVFLFLGNSLLEMINIASSKLTPTLPLISLSSEYFWMTLTLSLMTTLICLCYWSQKDIRANINFVKPLLVSKFVSSLFFFLFFIFVLRCVAYFVGLIVDGSIFIVTYYFYRAVKKEESAM